MRIASAFALLILALCLTPDAAARVYVDHNAPGPYHDGDSWDTAFLTIQAGVNDADPLDEQVWVADGTYVENVLMGEGVAIYGGFLGAEPGGYETELDQRDWVSHIATIDGNQSGSCVVMAVYACVDGFTITNGSGTLVSGYRHGGGFYCKDLWATGGIANNTIAANSANNGDGGGIYCYYSSPTVSNVAVTGNTAGRDGGGIYCDYYASPSVAAGTIAENSAGRDGGGVYCRNNSSPTVTTKTITRNAAGSKGGGLYCSGSSSPAVTTSTISKNAAGSQGGGVYCSGSSSPAVTCCAITGNSASGSGGGIYCEYSSSPTLTGTPIVGNSSGGTGGGIYCLSSSSPTVTDSAIRDNSAGSSGGGMYCCGSSSPTLTNNTITGNSAGNGSGGAIYCDDFSAPKLTNNAVTSNSARYGHGGGIYSTWVSPALSHNDFWGNLPDNYYGCVPGEGDISADPLFVNGAAGDFHLTGESSCIDAGTNTPPGGLPETDWEGDDRIINDTVDIGADEYVTIYTAAPDPQPGSGGPLFGGSQAGFPAWVWFSIPLTPDCPAGGGCADPTTLLGFDCKGKLWYWHKYGKYPQVYNPPFLVWDLAVGNSYLLRLTESVANPSYEGLSPFIPWTFEFKLGKMGWTWVGKPGLTELTGDTFMDSVRVRYPSDDTGLYRTARQDRAATPDNWITWGWAFYDTYLQGPKTFTPYAPFGNRTCYPWIGYRVWVRVGTAQSDADPNQVTLIWP